MDEVQHLHYFLYFIYFSNIILFSFAPFKIGYEFDFIREADSMERIKRFLYKNNKKRPVLVPRVMRDMVTRSVILQKLFPYCNLNLQSKTRTSFFSSPHNLRFLGTISNSRICFYQIEELFGT